MNPHHFVYTHNYPLFIQFLHNQVSYKLKQGNYYFMKRYTGNNFHKFVMYTHVRKQKACHLNLIIIETNNIIGEYYHNIITLLFTEYSLFCQYRSKL